MLLDRLRKGVASYDTEPMPEPALKEPWMIPRDYPSKDFVNPASHPNILERLAKLHHVAIAGYTGLGKTEIALQYCHYAREHKIAEVFWVDASSASNLIVGYTAITDHLGWNLRDEVGRDISEVVTTMFSERKDPWLLVLDDIMESKIERWISRPCEPRSQVLITTQDQITIERFINDDEIHLKNGKAYGIPEAKRFFKKQARGDQADDPSTLKLFGRLDYNPVAIAQAGSFIKRFKVSISDYATLLESEQKNLTAQPLGSYHKSRNYRTSSDNAIIESLMVTLRYLQQRNESAVAAIFFLSVLAPVSIPYFLFGNNRCSLEKAISTLVDLSLVSESAFGAFHNVRRVVHQATRDFLWRHGDPSVVKEDAAQALINGHPFKMVSRLEIEKCSQLAIHTETILGRGLRDWPHVRMWLLKRIARFEIWKGDYAKASLYLAEIRDHLARAPDSAIEKIEAAHEHGEALMGLAKYEEAEKELFAAKAFPQSLQHWSRDDSPLAMELDVSNIKLLNARADHEEAKMLFESNRQRQGGKFPSSECKADYSMIVTNYVPGICIDGGKKMDEVCFNDMHSAWERLNSLGRDRPDMFLAQSILGVAQQYMFTNGDVPLQVGNYHKAQELQENALRGLEKRFGKRHQLTLEVLCNFAGVLLCQDQYQAVGEKARQAYEGLKKAMVPLHPLTYRAEMILALAYEGQSSEETNFERKNLLLGKAESRARSALRSTEMIFAGLPTFRPENMETHSLVKSYAPKLMHILEAQQFKDSVQEAKLSREHYASSSGCIGSCETDYETDDETDDER